MPSLMLVPLAVSEKLKQTHRQTELRFIWTLSSGSNRIFYSLQTPFEHIPGHIFSVERILILLNIVLVMV